MREWICPVCKMTASISIKVTYIEHRCESGQIQALEARYPVPTVQENRKKARAEIRRRILRARQRSYDITEPGTHVMPILVVDENYVPPASAAPSPLHTDDHSRA